MRIVVTGADYSALSGIDSDATAWLTASGISNPTIRFAYNAFVKGLKSNNLWSKIDHAFAILGGAEAQVKHDIKNPSGATLGTISNTINKGIVLTGSGNVGGPVVTMPMINRTFLNSIISNGGHGLYFINQTLAPSNGSVALLLVSQGSNIDNPLFWLTGSASGPAKKTIALDNSIIGLEPAYTAPGVFGFTKTGSTGKFFGNGTLLGSTAFPSASASPDSGVVTIGSPVFPVNNTVPFFSFGQTVMSDDDMATYTTLINQLIFNVHGISV